MVPEGVCLCFSKNCCKIYVINVLSKLTAGQGKVVLITISVFLYQAILRQWKQWCTNNKEDKCPTDVVSL